MPNKLKLNKDVLAILGVQDALKVGGGEDTVQGGVDFGGSSGHDSCHTRGKQPCASLRPFSYCCSGTYNTKCM